MEIEPNKLLQVLSDGPNVNLAFLDILNRFREDNEQPQGLPKSRQPGQGKQGAHFS